MNLDLSTEITAALGIDLSTLIAHIIAAFIIFILIYVFIWKKVVAHLNKREKDIRDEIESASELNEQAFKHKKELEEKLTSASVTANEIIAQANMDAGEERKKIMTKATSDADLLINNAKIMIEAEKQSQKKAQDHASILAAYNIARKILGKHITVDENNDLTKEFIKDIEDINEE